MLIIDPSHEILAMHIDPALIELAGRTCYKSEAKGTCSAPKDSMGVVAEGSCAANGANPDNDSCSGCSLHPPSQFICMLLKRGHESVLEHSMMSVRFITNRGVTHEIVRHRLCAFSQESTRYVNYEKKGLVVIRPVWCGEALLGEWPLRRDEWNEDHEAAVSDGGDYAWLNAMNYDEMKYLGLLDAGWRPEQAREVLPNSTKTEIVVTANAREWRHIFKLRTAPAAHPEMRRIMTPLLKELKRGDEAVLFEDIQVKEDSK